MTMSLTDPFQSIIPQNVGKYNHATDKALAGQQNSAFAQVPIPHQIPSQQSSPSVVIIKERTRPWFYPHFWYSGHQAPQVVNLRHTASTFQKKTKNEKDNENSEAGVIASLIFFSMVITLGAAGIAYSFKALNKLTDNILAQRKIVSSAIKSGLATFLGLAGLKVGVGLGSYYGPVLVGNTFIGSALSGFLLAGAGLGLGLFAGKYLAKLCFYIYSSGKNAQEKAFSLPLSSEQQINDSLKTASAYKESRANLMYCYLLNKIEVAKFNMQSSSIKQVGQAWLQTLEGYKKALKSGNFSEELTMYFDSEWEILKGEKSENEFKLSDDRYFDHQKEMIEQDFIALSIITANEAYLRPKELQISRESHSPQDALPNSEQIQHATQFIYPSPQNWVPSAPSLEEFAVPEGRNYLPSEPGKQNLQPSSLLPSAEQYNPSAFRFSNSY